MTLEDATNQAPGLTTRSDLDATRVSRVQSPKGSLLPPGRPPAPSPWPGSVPGAGGPSPQTPPHLGPRCVRRAGVRVVWSNGDVPSQMVRTRDELGELHSPTSFGVTPLRRRMVDPTFGVLHHPTMDSFRCSDGCVFALRPRWAVETQMFHPSHSDRAERNALAATEYAESSRGVSHAIASG